MKWSCRCQYLNTIWISSFTLLSRLDASVTKMTWKIVNTLWISNRIRLPNERCMYRCFVEPISFRSALTNIVVVNWRNWWRYITDNRCARNKRGKTRALLRRSDLSYAANYSSQWLPTIDVTRLKKKIVATVWYLYRNDTIGYICIFNSKIMFNVFVRERERERGGKREREREREKKRESSSDFYAVSRLFL